MHSRHVSQSFANNVTLFGLPALVSAHPSFKACILQYASSSQLVSQLAKVLPILQ